MITRIERVLDIYKSLKHHERMYRPLSASSRLSLPNYFRNQRVFLGSAFSVGGTNKNTVKTINTVQLPMEAKCLSGIFISALKQLPNIALCQLHQLPTSKKHSLPFAFFETSLIMARLLISILEHFRLRHMVPNKHCICRQRFKLMVWEF
jgi:hypothetical protein